MQVNKRKTIGLVGTARGEREKLGLVMISGLIGNKISRDRAVFFRLVGFRRNDDTTEPHIRLSIIRPIIIQTQQKGDMV